MTRVPLPVVLYYCGAGNSQRAETTPESPLYPVLPPPLFFWFDSKRNSLGWEFLLLSNMVFYKLIGLFERALNC